MATVLFLNGPSHGHVNPTLGIVSELIRNGENVIYFCTEQYRNNIEKTGAIFKGLGNEAKVPKGNASLDKNKQLFDVALRMMLSTEQVVSHILNEIRDEKIDYMIYDSMYPVGNIISQILKVPTICSHAVFAKADEIAPAGKNVVSMEAIKDHPGMDAFKQMADRIREKYGAEVPPLSGMLLHYGDLNIAYTSKYFVPHAEDYDSSFRFIGGPLSTLDEIVDFPFEKLENKRVIFISLGTAFNNVHPEVYDLFFRCYENEKDTTVVIAAYNIDTSGFEIPDNFIVRNYVPQNEILKYTDVAVSHGGLNTTSDLVYYSIPFVVIPIGGDQPYMAERFTRLGAAITLDKDSLTPEVLRDAIEEVSTVPSYRENLEAIRRSFEEAGGYKKAVADIIEFKKEREIS